MTRKREKAAAAPAPPGEITASDREALTEAYRSGLITAWKRDDQRGYRLTLGGRQDEYVDVENLAAYLETVRRGAARVLHPAAAAVARVPNGA